VVVVWLKEFAVLKELRLLLKACDIFSIFTALNFFRGKVLIDLWSVWKSGVDRKALRLTDNSPATRSGIRNTNVPGPGARNSA